jgi:hypothetical protein
MIQEQTPWKKSKEKKVIMPEHNFGWQALIFYKFVKCSFLILEAVA